MAFLGWILPLRLQEAVHFIVSLGTATVTSALSHTKTASFENPKNRFCLSLQLDYFNGRVSTRYTSWQVQALCATKIPCWENDNMSTVFSTLCRWISLSIFFSSLFLRLLNDGVSAFCMKTSVTRFPLWRKKRLLLSLLFNAEGVYLFYCNVIPIDFAL